MKNDTRNYLSRLLAVTMRKYGATPFFKVIVKKNGEITVSTHISYILVSSSKTLISIHPLHWSKYTLNVVGENLFPMENKIVGASSFVWFY